MSITWATPTLLPPSQVFFQIGLLFACLAYLMEVDAKAPGTPGILYSCMGTRIEYPGYMVRTCRYAPAHFVCHMHDETLWRTRCMYEVDLNGRDPWW